MDHATAERFADDWVRAWNAHDLDRILAHFAEDATFTSPVAAQLVAGSGGLVRGRDALRRYWAEGHGTYLGGTDNPTGATPAPS